MGQFDIIPYLILLHRQFIVAIQRQTLVLAYRYLPEMLLILTYVGCRRSLFLCVPSKFGERQICRGIWSPRVYKPVDAQISYQRHLIMGINSYPCCICSNYDQLVAIEISCLFVQSCSTYNMNELTPMPSNCMEDCQIDIKLFDYIHDRVWPVSVVVFKILVLA